MGPTVSLSESLVSSWTTGSSWAMDTPAGLSSDLISFPKIGDGPDLGSRLPFALDHRFLSFKTKILCFVFFKQQLRSHPKCQPDQSGCSSQSLGGWEEAQSLTHLVLAPGRPPWSLWGPLGPRVKPPPHSCMLRDDPHGLCCNVAPCPITVLRRG